MGQLYCLISYGSQDVYLDSHISSSHERNGNPYFRELASPKQRIHAAGNRHGKNKKMQKESQKRKEYEDSNSDIILYIVLG